MLGSGIAMWQICCRIVVSLSVGGVRSRCSVFVAGVRVVEFGSYADDTQSRNLHNNLVQVYLQVAKLAQVFFSCAGFLQL